ncbi:BRCA1-associated protein [Tremella mesenterica]|uniref:BRCA1-associated protein n=1 Tax=Tremella mesenterica TaxID=5217 RepID=A0A4Q1BFF0_TREME|nr:BRCA1-associated protein [Tremella mesenterica]
MSFSPQNLYSLIIAVHEPSPDVDDPSPTSEVPPPLGEDWRLGEITVDWVDFTREKSLDKDQPPKSSYKIMSPKLPNTAPTPLPQQNKGFKKGRPIPGAPSPTSSPTSAPGKPKKPTADALSLQPLLGHVPGPNPLDSSVASGVTAVGRGVVHLFRHAPPPSLIASIDAHPVGEGSKSHDTSPWAGDKAEGEDGSLVAILAVPAWMRPADFLEFIGGWGTCLEGVRMIREATTPNRSIVLLKFRDPLQASDFMIIFTGRAFSSLDSRETCHPIRIHHLVLHRLENPNSFPISIPAFPPSIYASRARELPELLRGIPENNKYELPSCPVCLERLDSTITGLVTLPCAHTFDCDCLRKWGDSRCPVCRVSHLLLSSAQSGKGEREEEQVTRLTQCSMCDSKENNWMCVVCGVVGCGRYSPGKGHARRHWEESGHVLAMELDTQRVWDYKGDNYVHRLIQTRTDGKLVELPSASSLVTPSAPQRLISTPTSRLNRPHNVNKSHNNDSPAIPTQTPRVVPEAKDHSHMRETPTNDNPSNRERPIKDDPIDGEKPDNEDTSELKRTKSLSSEEAGPSSGDIDKISTIEAITLEYSYLLSSQLEAMRQHYETSQAALLAQIADLEGLARRVEKAEAAAKEATKNAQKAETKAEKAAQLARTLQTSLSAERAMSEGLSKKVKVLSEDKERLISDKKNKEEEIKGLEETVKDLMYNFEAGAKIQALGDEGGKGGDIVVGKKGKR